MFVGFATLEQKRQKFSGKRPRLIPEPRQPVYEILSRLNYTPDWCRMPELGIHKNQCRTNAIYAERVSNFRSPCVTMPTRVDD